MFINNNTLQEESLSQHRENECKQVMNIYESSFRAGQNRYQGNFSQTAFILIFSGCMGTINRISLLHSVYTT